MIISSYVTTAISQLVSVSHARISVTLHNFWSNVADEPETPPPGKKKGSGLSGSWHGVPKPVLLLGGGLALYLGYRWYKNRQSSSTTTTPSTTSTGNTTGVDPSGGYGGYGGGGYGGGYNPPAAGSTPFPITASNPTGGANPDGTPMTAITNPTTGVVTTLTPSTTTPGDYQVPLGTQVITSANDFSGYAAGLNAAGFPTLTPADIAAAMAGSPAASKTTPTGVAAQQAPINQALATSTANLVKAQAAEKAHPSAANAAAVKAHQSQVAAGR